MTNRTLLRIALRDHRRSLLGFLAFGVVMMAVQVAGFVRIAGATPAARQAFAQQTSAFSRQFTWLFPEPVRIDTLDGFLQWRVFSFMVVAMAVWAVFLGVAAVRRGEECGLLDVWLSAPVSRTRHLLVRSAAGFLALAIVVSAACLSVVVAARGQEESVDALALAGIGFSMWATAAACFGFALLLSQIVARARVAAGIGAAVVTGSFLVNGFSRQIDGLRVPRLISPFHWFDSASALAPGAAYDARGPLFLLLAGALFVALAAHCLNRRDTGAGLLRARVPHRPAVVAPSRNPLLRRPVLSTLYRERWSLLAWSLGIAAGALFVVGVSKPAAGFIDSTAELRRFLPRISHGASTVQLYIGFAWFGLAALLSVAFAVVTVSHWIADDLEGRLAATLSAPVSRRRVVVERFAGLAVELAALAVVNLAAVLLGTALFGVTLNHGDLVVAAVLLIPVGLVFAALGGVLSATAPRATVFALAGLAMVSYLLFTLGPVFRWPSWVLDFSVFQLYGTPLVEGVFVTGLIALLGATAAGLTASLVTFRHREVGG